MLYLYRQCLGLENKQEHYTNTNAILCRKPQAYASAGLKYPHKLTGGAERNRTADLLNAIQALSQLSYGPVSIFIQRYEYDDQESSPSWNRITCNYPQNL